MTATADFGELIRTLLRGDFDTYERKMRGLTENNAWEEYSTFLAVSFVKAVEQRFAQGSDPAAVIRFVADAREQFDESGHDIDPTDAEALVWSAIGEHDASRVDVSSIMKIRSVLLHRLLTDRRISDEELDEFIARSERTAADWRARVIRQVEQ